MCDLCDGNYDVRPTVVTIARMTGKLDVCMWCRVDKRVKVFWVQPKPGRNDEHQYNCGCTSWRNEDGWRCLLACKPDCEVQTRLIAKAESLGKPVVNSN